MKLKFKTAKTTHLKFQAAKAKGTGAPQSIYKEALAKFFKKLAKNGAPDSLCSFLDDFGLTEYSEKLLNIQWQDFEYSVDDSSWRGEVDNALKVLLEKLQACDESKAKELVEEAEASGVRLIKKKEAAISQGFVEE